MKVVIQIILVLAIIGLGVYLYEIVMQPIRQKEEWKKIKNARVERLDKARKAEIAYRELNGKFAGNWDSLVTFVKTAKFPIIKAIGDPNIPDSLQKGHVTSDTTYVVVEDSIFPGYPVDSLPYIPYAPGHAKFKIQSGTVVVGGVTVNVFQITDTKPYNNEITLQVGSMNEPNYAGNWK